MMITTTTTTNEHDHGRDWLPAGYSTTPPPDAVSTRGADAPGFREYGGADRSKATDGANIRYKAICAWKDKALLRPDEEEFGFRIFREYPAGVWSEVIYWGAGHVFCPGRGEINVQGGWIAALPDGTDDDGEIPGWVPIPTGGEKGEPGPPGPPGPAGDYTPCTPNRYTPYIDGQTFSGGRSLDMAALFDLPVSCRAYNVRLVAQAAVSNVRGRLGTEQQPGQLTCNTQLPNLQVHTVGIVNAGDGGRLWLSVVDGATGQAASGRVWLQVAGYWL